MKTSCHLVGVAFLVVRMMVAYRYLGENGACEQQIITDDLLRGMSLLGEKCIDNQILRSNWVPVWHWSDWVTSLIWVNVWFAPRNGTVVNNIAGKLCGDLGPISASRPNDGNAGELCLLPYK